MFEPILFAVLTGVAVTIANFALFLMLRRNLMTEKEALIDATQQFFSPQGENPSQFAQTTAEIGNQFASILVHHLSQTAKGLQSGAVRQEKAVDAAMAKDLISASNPLLGMAIESMPGLSKLCRRNPELMALAAQKLGGMMGKQGEQGPQDVGHPGGNHPVFSMTEY